MPRAWILLVAILALPLASARPLLEDRGTIHLGASQASLPPTAPPLRVTLALGMPVLPGQSEFVSIVRVLPAGASSWSGVWWSTSEAGSTNPLRLTVDATGAFVDHHTTAASLQGGQLHVRYHFLSTDRPEWDYDAPPAPVLADAPQGDAPVFAGAAADDDVLAFVPWNIMPRAVEMGYTIHDADGAVVRDARLGGCFSDTNETEAGCRVPYVIPREGATLELWDAHDGTRRTDASLDIADLARHAYLYGK